MPVWPTADPAEVVSGVRLYYYDIKHEFRLNCGRLVDRASPDDLLIIERAGDGATYEQQRYDYSATVIVQAHPSYVSLLEECPNKVVGSRKRWGYF